MAITLTSLTEGEDEVNRSSYTTSSISPTANRLVIAVIGNNKATSPPNVPTLSGASMTWVEITTALYDDIASPNKRVTMFRALKASPGSGVITIDLVNEQRACKWSFFEFAGIDTGGTDGSDAIVQSATNAVDSGTSLTVTLASFASSTNATVGGVGRDAVDAITQGTGFTEIHEQSGEGFSIETEWRDDADTTVDWSFDTSDRQAGVAIEIAGAAAAAAIPNIIFQVKQAIERSSLF